MNAVTIEQRQRISKLESELANFRSMMEHVNQIPDEVSLANVEVAARSFPLNGILGGDHIILLDFKQRYNLETRIDEALRRGREEVAERLRSCRERVGVLLADSCGHGMTDALLTAMLHQAFLTGVLYELETEGHVTAKLFENLNTRFVQSSSINKFVTMIYGEISDRGTFRFICAGHPKPLVYSARYDRVVDIDPEHTRNFLPIGVFPSRDDIDQEHEDGPLPCKERYTVNEVSLMGVGDIMLLQTDGLYEHTNGDEPYTPRHLERIIRDVRELPPYQIVDAIYEDMVRYAPPQDDTSLVVIKKIA
jgi:serine phosphatase RsbU (regulator of sigma subunit)